MQLSLMLHLNLTLKLKTDTCEVNTLNILTLLSQSLFGVLCVLSHSTVPGSSEPPSSSPPAAMLNSKTVQSGGPSEAFLEESVHWICTQD